jgi:hypothetical protein
MNWKGCSNGYNLKYHQNIWLEGLRKTMKNPSHNSMCPRWDLNLESPEYNSQVLAHEETGSILGISEMIIL